MQWDLWLAFIGASIAISVSPGAGAIQSMSTGLSCGLRRGYWSITGLEIGLMCSWRQWPWGWARPSHNPWSPSP